MKKKKLILPLVLIGLSLTSCNGDKLSSYNKNIKNSIKKVASVNLVISIKDQNHEVFNLSRSVIKQEYDGNISYSCEDQISKLNSSYVLEKTTDKNTYNQVEKALLFNFNLSSKVVDSYDTNDNVLSGVVKNENISSFTNLEVTSINGDLNFEIAISEKKITKFNCTYTTKSNKSVSIETVYNY